MPKQPEGKLVTELQKRIRKHGGCCFKIHGGDNPFQAVGIPDLLCCIAGLFVGIETKLPGEKLSRMQVLALHEIFASGGVSAVIETVGQGDRLLSTIEERADIAKDGSGLVFDRGHWSTRFDLHSK